MLCYANNIIAEAVCDSVAGHLPGIGGRLLQPELQAVLVELPG